MSTRPSGSEDWLAQKTSRWYVKGACPTAPVRQFHVPMYDVWSTVGDPSTYE
jgi:hypothetical protein